MIDISKQRTASIDEALDYIMKVTGCTRRQARKKLADKVAKGKINAERGSGEPLSSKFASNIIEDPKAALQKMIDMGYYPPPDLKDDMMRASTNQVSRDFVSNADELWIPLNKVMEMYHVTFAEIYPYLENGLLVSSKPEDMSLEKALAEGKIALQAWSVVKWSAWTGAQPNSTQ